MKNRKELWKCIPGYSRYIASNLGNIMKLPSYAPNPSTKVTGKTDGSPGYIKAQRATPPSGHLQVGLTNDAGEKKMEYVHRLVAIAFLKKRPGKEIVLHKDDNPANNHVDNLMWGTHYINSQMITSRKLSPKRGKKIATMEKVVTTYYTNKSEYAGKVKDLIKLISEDVGICIPYVYSLIYCPEGKEMARNLKLLNENSDI